MPEKTIVQFTKMNLTVLFLSPQYSQVHEFFVTQANGPPWLFCPSGPENFPFFFFILFVVLLPATAKVFLKKIGNFYIISHLYIRTCISKVINAFYSWLPWNYWISGAHPLIKLIVQMSKTWGLRTAGSVIPFPNSCSVGDVVSNTGWQIAQATQVMDHTPKELRTEMTSTFTVNKKVFYKKVCKKFSVHQQ